MGLLGLWEDRGSTLIYVRNEKTIMNMQRHRRRSAEIVPGNLVKKLEVTSIPSPSIVGISAVPRQRGLNEETVETESGFTQRRTNCKT